MPYYESILTCEIVPSGNMHASSGLNYVSSAASSLVLGQKIRYKSISDYCVLLEQTTNNKKLTLSLVHGGNVLAASFTAMTLFAPTHPCPRCHPFVMGTVPKTKGVAEDNPTPLPPCLSEILRASVQSWFPVDTATVI